MRGTIVRTWTPSYRPIADATRPGVQKLADINQLMLVEDETETFTRHPSWNKLNPVIDQLQVTDARPVLYMDVDIGVRDPGYPILTQAVEGIAFSSDSNGLCAGLFIASTWWSMEFLQMVRKLGPTFDRPDRQEQDAIKRLRENFATVRDRTPLIPVNVVSNPEVVITNDHAFARHFWANGWEDKKALAEFIRQQMA